MLERYIKIYANLRIFRHLHEDIFWKICRIRIMDAKPFYSVNSREFLEQLREGTSVIEVKSIICRILRQEDKFPDPCPRQRGSLGDNVLHGYRAVGATNERDCTIRAPSVTAFGDFDVGIAFMFRDIARDEGTCLHPEIPQYRREVSGAEPCVNLRNLFRKFIRITLRKAAEDNKLPRLSPLFALDRLQNLIYRLFFCISYEAAGVQQQEVHGPVIIHNLELIRGQLGEQMFGINRILRTAESDDSKLSFHLL